LQSRGEPVAPDRGGRCDGHDAQGRGDRLGGGERGSGPSRGAGAPPLAEASPQTRLFLECRYLPVWRALQAAPKDPGLQQMASFIGDEATALASAGLGSKGAAPLPAGSGGLTFIRHRGRRPAVS